MLALPPELLDAIVVLVDDLESLKSCSLVASTLRYTSQRILIRSLTVQAKNYVQVGQLLIESPHIADYITHLSLKLHDLASLDIDTLHQVLAKLQNLRLCFLNGMWHSSPRSSALRRSTIPPLVSDFLARQPPRALYLMAITISPALLWRFAAAVPTLHVYSVVIEEEPDPTVARAAVSNSVLESLFLNSRHVGEFFARPQNISCVAGLRHLSAAGPFDDWAPALIEAASRTLEHIQFDCTYDPSPPLLQRLPALRTVQFTFSGQITTETRAEYISHATPTLSSLATPEMSPALADVVIKQQFTSRVGADDAVPYVPLMKMLDAALRAYAAAPCIRWILATRNEESRYAGFADSVRRGMPEAHGAGRLVLEVHVLSSKRFKKKAFRI
ncbi:hypothetical protein MVEN_01930700 [Mycena venus]|uniref:F-box domain-containing protein n=1 Tax=Mycena venus TaxID=2733690 RepID=A0A8H7CLV4_9AGAR|nr:hypothetical protein MVEN_01930700 [Mycena venus]